MGAKTTAKAESATQAHGSAWANATPAGLVALAVSCIGFFALLTGRIETSAMPLLGCWLLGGFVVQLVVGLLDLKSNSMTGGNTFLFFSAFFMLVGGLEMMLKYKAILSGAPLDGRIDGYAWCILTVVLWLWTPAFCKGFSLLSVIILLLDIALPFIALIDLGVLSKDWGMIPGWSLLGAAVVAVYLCSAMVVNGAYGRRVYPVF